MVNSFRIAASRPRISWMGHDDRWEKKKENADDETWGVTFERKMTCKTCPIRHELYVTPLLVPQRDW